MDRVELLKKYLEITGDEQLFYNSSSVKKFPNSICGDLHKEIKNVKNLDRCINNVQRELKNADASDSIKEFDGYLSDMSRDSSNFESSFQKAIENIDDLEMWATFWQEIAMDLFSHVINKHPDELDQIGSFNYHEIDENLMKSLEGVDKFNL